MLDYITWGSLGSMCKFGQLWQLRVGGVGIDTVTLTSRTVFRFEYFLKIPHEGGPPGFWEGRGPITAPATCPPIIYHTHATVNIFINNISFIGLLIPVIINT